MKWLFSFILIVFSAVAMADDRPAVEKDCLPQAMINAPTAHFQSGEQILPAPFSKQMHYSGTAPGTLYYFIGIGQPGQSPRFGYLVIVSDTDCSLLMPPRATLRAD